ncbi:triacylglycerol lipase [Cooperia oncophora]
MRIWKNGMKDDLATLSSQHSGYELWITGHSLGGAMASLAASYIAHNKLFAADKLPGHIEVKIFQIKLVTFGQPRTGDKDYAAAVEKEVPYAFRVTHSHDSVPHLPLENMEGYYHHKTEAFYKKGMAVGAHYYVCYDMGESTFCSDGNLADTSIKDHLHYFEKDVPYAFRVTHSHDSVPHLPLENMEGYYHHKTEAFYKKGMAVGAHYYVCYDMGESTFCSDGNLADTSIKDHLHYFEKDVSEYGVKGCK